MPKIYLTLNMIGSPSFQREVGPFAKVTWSGVLIVDDGQPCAYWDAGQSHWYVTDGAALGDASLTDATASIIFGQAKEA
jgi:hypothetical protein